MIVTDVNPGFISYREEVFQVEWDPNHETVLASSADDRRLMVWDLNRYFTRKISATNVLVFPFIICPKTYSLSLFFFLLRCIILFCNFWSPIRSRRIERSLSLPHSVSINKT